MLNPEIEERQKALEGERMQLIFEISVKQRDLLDILLKQKANLVEDNELIGVLTGIDEINKKLQ